MKPSWIERMVDVGFIAAVGATLALLHGFGLFRH